jgi:hypothetical protein
MDGRRVWGVDKSLFWSFWSDGVDRATATLTMVVRLCFLFDRWIG